jgi:hypothetical protein
MEPRPSIASSHLEDFVRIPWNSGSKLVRFVGTFGLVANVIYDELGFEFTLKSIRTKEIPIKCR